MDARGLNGPAEILQRHDVCGETPAACTESELRQALAGQQASEHFGRQRASVRPGRVQRLRQEQAELFGLVTLAIRPGNAAARQLDRSSRGARAALTVAFADGLREERNQFLGRDGVIRLSCCELLFGHVTLSKVVRLNANRLESNLPITSAPYDSQRESETGRETDREKRALVGNLPGLQDVRHAVLKRL